ncbi:MAG: putative ABC transport system ATP-binding protein [Planctomycetota bacterium]
MSLSNDRSTVDEANGNAIDGVATKQKAIVLEEICMSYSEGGRKKTILSSANLTVEAGELIVFLGRSGSGKSTLLNLLGGIDQPDSGRILVAGEDLSAATEQDRTLFRRRHIGFIFQSFNLVPTLTVLENVTLRLNLLGQNAEAIPKAMKLLDEVGLADRADSWPERLSGGEQQRVAIAAALIHEPELVLADEPTGNLDLETGQQITDLLDRLTRRMGKTLVMATHSKEVMGIADRVLSIRDGHLEEIKSQ